MQPAWTNRNSNSQEEMKYNQNFENTGSVQKCAQNAGSNVLKDIHGYAQRSKALGRMFTCYAVCDE